ncbi:MAG TPA: GatB/YqeY domain-containing protein [Hyphomicrobiales bacterium]|nr:GatB/YqeY domain-containing protein [Hyphomicrobiales bacterium]
MREAINAALKNAMKTGDKRRVSTLRMMNAAIKDRDIEARGQGKGPLGDDELMALFQKMIKQRQESAEIYAKAGRGELEAQEREEIAIIAAYLPQQMDDAAIAEAVRAVAGEIGAAGMRDMGKVMAALRERYAGRMDFAKASAAAKGVLG